MTTKPRRAIWRPLLLAAGLIACGSEQVIVAGPLPPDGVIEVDFRTDKSQYTPGAAAKTTMVNRSTRTLVMGFCDDVLERQAGDVWVEIPPGNVACIAMALIIAPGDSATLALDLKTASVAGTYRVRRRFNATLGTSAELMYRRSNTFSVAR
ncbi:MAG: hypothetical protein P3B98_06220 [Gemmatimonadota bacterium]|nr:hypothetical protein [Gemmatimonadota bacterium]